MFRGSLTIDSFYNGNDFGLIEAEGRFPFAVTGMDDVLEISSCNMFFYRDVCFQEISIIIMYRKVVTSHDSAYLST